MLKVSKHKPKTITGLVLLTLLLTSSRLLPAQEIQVIKFDQLHQIITDKNAPVRVINFWATWCAPCVKELPQFEDLLDKYKNSPTEVILVSMDFVQNLDSKVKKFAEKKNLKSKLYLLDETDYNSFIDRIDPSWSGAIPATLIMDARNEKRTFLEKEFTEGELEKAYLDFIQ